MPYESPLHHQDSRPPLVARPCSDVPAAASNEQPAFACAPAARTRHPVLSLGRCDAARTLLAVRARRTVLVGVGPCVMKAHHAIGITPSLGARHCSVVLAVVSSEQPAFACAHTRRVTAQTLSERGAPRALVARTHRSALVGVGPWPSKAHYARETAVSLRARSCSDVPAAASN